MYLQLKAGNRHAFQCHNRMQGRCKWDRGALSSTTKLDLGISRVLTWTRSVVLGVYRFQQDSPGLRSSVPSWWSLYLSLAPCVDHSNRAIYNTLIALQLDCKWGLGGASEALWDKEDILGKVASTPEGEKGEYEKIQGTRVIRSLYYSKNTGDHAI